MNVFRQGTSGIDLRPWQEVLREHAAYAAATNGFDGGNSHGNQLTVALQGLALFGA